MSGLPIWLTTAGNLGIIPEEEYYEFYFDAYNTTGGNLSFSVISGQLPRGLEIKNDGLISGIPSGRAAGVPAAVEKVTTSNFTIRITNIDSEVNDRTFSLTIAGILPQQFIPESESLGSFVDGTYVFIDINTIEPNSLLRSTFSIIGGGLPIGLSLNPVTGVISGYIDTVQTAQSVENANFDKSPWDTFGFDFTGTDTSKNFQFVIEANNGVTIETKTYTMYVISIDDLTADNSLLTADNVSLITADVTGPYHDPVLITAEGLVGSVRQNTRADIQIVGRDFDGDTLTYEIQDPTSLPTGLTLNPISGWITGTVPYSTLGYSTYEFNVRVYKTSDPIYVSDWRTYSIQLLGQVTDSVTWLTPSDLGSLNTGELSELYIAASTFSNRTLNYRLENSTGRLPAGLILTQTGLISGRITFETFMLDSGTTTIDQAITTFDQVYTFTVAAYDTGNYVYDTKTFTITLVKADQRPYENLYITAYPDRVQREIYNSIINNTDLIPLDYLYRLDDPWFGKNILRRSLFMAGLEPDLAATYAQSMTYNHYWKNLGFGNIKTARALDQEFNITYEVVYIELIDRQVNEQGLGPNIAVNLPANSRNISTIYPNSFPNMTYRIENGIGYENRSIIPKWMTSRQADGTVLGFIKALVLCYTKPGKSAEVAYRISQVQSSFNDIDFTVDRYEIDNSYSNNYNKASNTFIVNNFIYASGTITANTNSNVVTGLTLNTIGRGTISGAFGDVRIYGTGTSFGQDVRVGRPLYREDTMQQLGTVNSVVDNTTLVLNAPLTATIYNLAYAAETSKTEFASDIFVGDTIVVNSNVRLGTVKSINNDASITLYGNSLATVANVIYLHNARDTYTTPGDNDKYLKFPKVGVIT